MRFNRFLPFAAILSTLLFLSCTQNVTGLTEKGSLDRDLSQAEKKLVETGELFSYNVFRQTTGFDSSENVFISPLSISVALGMTMNGASGNTYDEMRETLAFNGLSQQEINEGYESLISLLREADSKVQMQIANSVWSREGFPVEDEFIQNLEEYFEAEAQELDFSNPASKEVINNWVDEKTNGLIEKIIEGQIPPEMVMYLINAIYFKGDWTYQFDEEETRPGTFYREDESPVEVPLMRMREGKFNVVMNEEVHMIDLPYGDSLFTMTVLMPGDSDKPLDEFIQNEVTQQNLDNWYEALQYQEIPLTLPKFKLEYEIKMNEILYSMGMEDAFTEGVADFSRINPDAPLFISEVRHKTFVEVNEAGTEAAAVTSVGIGVTSAPPSFVVNRPFVFMIREQNSGAILFMGKVKNPNA